MDSRYSAISKLTFFFTLSIHVDCFNCILFMRKDRLTMGYFDNLDNGFLNKYKKNLKYEKKIIDVFLYLNL
jgi:hypothetical protein